MLEQLQENLGYKASDTHWLEQAMTHKSSSRSEFNNERLEFMGDAIVDCVIADILFDQFPDDDEGNLSRKRAALVNEDSLYQLALRLKLDEFIVVTGGEAGAQLRANKRLLAGALEAVIGAIYKDAGFSEAYEWVKNLYQKEGQLDFSQYDFEKDYKTRFQEMIQEKLKVTPTYKLLGNTGPDHQKSFQVQVLVGDEVYGEGSGESKKIAAQMAAQAAIEKVKNEL